MNLTIFPANKNGEQCVLIRSYDYTTHIINTKKENVDEYIAKKDKLQKQTYGLCAASLGIGIGLLKVIDKTAKKGNDMLSLAATLVPVLATAFYTGAKHTKLAQEFIKKAENDNNLETIA